MKRFISAYLEKDSLAQSKKLLVGGSLIFLGQTGRLFKHSLNFFHTSNAHAYSGDVKYLFHIFIQSTEIFGHNF